MVEPIDADQWAGRRALRAAGRAGAGLAVALAAGCSLVPKAKLEDCHRVTQTLRSENNRLKDVALDLRAQNQDLSQRAVDDARRLTAQEEAVERLERSVSAYQAEREQLADALEAVKRQVRLAVSPHASAVPSRLRSFAAGHPGWSFDPATMTVSAAVEGLFEPGSDRLRPDAAEALKALAGELSGPGADALRLEVAGPAEAPPVARAGYEPGSKSGGAAAAAAGRFLSAARAARVRDRLVSGSGLDPARARLAPPPRRAADAPDAAERTVEIRLGAEAAAPALDAPAATDR